MEHKNDGNFFDRNPVYKDIFLNVCLYSFGPIILTLSMVEVAELIGNRGVEFWEYCLNYLIALLIIVTIKINWNMIGIRPVKIFAAAVIFPCLAVFSIAQLNRLIYQGPIPYIKYVNNVLFVGLGLLIVYFLIFRKRK